MNQENNQFDADILNNIEQAADVQTPETAYEEEPKAEPEVPEETTEAPEESAQPEEEHHKPRIPLKTRFNQMRRETYEAQHRAEQIARENEQLRQQLELYSQAANKHYEDALQLKINQATEAKLQAKEMGDAQREIEAEKALMQATYEFNNAQNQRAQQAWVQSQQMQQEPWQDPNYNHQAEAQRNLQQWYQHNPWINPESDNYDQNLADYINAYAGGLELDLRRGGKEHLLYSRDFMTAINNEVRHVMQNRDQFFPDETYETPQPRQQQYNQPQYQQRQGMQRQQPRGQLSMSGPKGHVGGAGNGTRPVAAKQQIKLTPNMKELAQNFGVSEEAYIEGIKRVQRQNVEKGYAPGYIGTTDYGVV